MLADRDPGVSPQAAQSVRKLSQSLGTTVGKECERQGLTSYLGIIIPDTQKPPETVLYDLRNHL